MTSTITDNPVARQAGQEGVRLAFFEGQTTRVHGDFSHLQIWVYLTRGGRLVVATRWRTYNGTAGHAVETPSAIAYFATERHILDLLAENGIRKRHLIFEAPEGLPRATRTIFRRSYSLWTERERRAVVAFFFAPRG